MTYANKQDLMDFIERFGGTSVDPSSILDSLEAMSTETGPYGLSLTGERQTHYIPDRIEEAAKILQGCIDGDVGSFYTTFEAVEISKIYVKIVKDVADRYKENTKDPCIIARPTVCAAEIILGKHAKNLKMRKLGNDKYGDAIRKEIERLTNLITDKSLFHKYQKEVVFEPPRGQDNEIIEITKAELP